MDAPAARWSARSWPSVRLRVAPHAPCLSSAGGVARRRRRRIGAGTRRTPTSWDPAADLRCRTCVDTSRTREENEGRSGATSANTRKAQANHQHAKHPPAIPPLPRPNPSPWRARAGAFPVRLTYFFRHDRFSGLVRLLNWCEQKASFFSGFVFLHSAQTRTRAREEQKESHHVSTQEPASQPTRVACRPTPPPRIRAWQVH